MTNKYFLTFALLLCLPVPAMAQSKIPRDCKIQPELIFNMSKAEYGAYNVWDAVHGEMNVDDNFASGVVLDSGNVVVVGEVASFGKPDRALQLIEYDGRGRVVWEVSHTITELVSIRKLLLTPAGFAVIGTVRGKGDKASAWFGVFDKTGKKLSEKTISAGKASLLPDDILLRGDGKGFIMSAAVGNEKNSLFHAEIYHLDVNGSVTDKHAYMPGLDNRIYGLSPDGKDAYVATGYLRGEDGRITGWILKLNMDGSLIWQRQYPRGASAQINKATLMVPEALIAAGETQPLNGGNIAAWVMMIDDGSGNVVWQRYYTDTMNQSAKDVIVNADGLASVMVQNTRPPNEEPSDDNNDFVRLLTVNERGVLTISDEYFNGEGAQAGQMIGGRAGERILMGRTDIVYKIEPKPGEPVETLKHGWDAWVVAGAPMEAFDDPCLAENPFRP
jgi:hypothetical protein